jgi:plasmid stabilization system protein ParE
VALDKPEAARHLATRIAAMVASLSLHPHLGRVGAEPGIRELVIGGMPYSILYRALAQRMIIITIWHSAQET